MSRTYKIALSGISGAFALAALLGAAFLPTANAVFWVIAALCLLIPLAGGNRGAIFSVLVFVAASSLALLISGNFFQILPYICFFGPYAIIWHFSNQAKLSVYLKYVLGYILLFLSVWLCYALIKELAFEHIAEIDEFVRQSWWLGLIIIAAGLPIYHLALKEGQKYINLAFKKYNEGKR